MGWYVRAPSNERADVDDSEPVDEELGELPGARRDALGVCRVLRDVHAHVSRARAGRRDDGLVSRERLDEPGAERRCHLGMPGVQVQLAATRLLAGELDIHPEPLQEGNGRPTHSRLERVDKAGDEQRHAHRASVQQRRPFDR